MYLHGELVNRAGNIIRVEILSQGNRTPEYEIGNNEEGMIWFGDDPVNVNSEINDTFDTLLTHSASIRLESRIPLTELYCSSCMEAVVNIFENGKCIFAGYIEPQAYSQSFNGYTDDVDLSCIDALSAMQYMRYENITTSEAYSALKQTATTKTFQNIIISALKNATRGLMISGSESCDLFYDGSKRLPDGTADKFFESIGISELLFLGDDEDSVWSLKDVLEELVKYLGLHIEQEGMTFHLFSWHSVKHPESVKSWIQLNGTGGAAWNGSMEINLTDDIVADTSTTLDIGETYNQISLTCNVTEVDTLIESPLSSDSLEACYPKRQLYMSSLGSIKDEDKDTIQYFFDLFYQNPERKSFPEAYWLKFRELMSLKDWYIRVKNNPNWTFSWWNMRDIYSVLVRSGTEKQEELPNRLGLEYRPLVPGSGIPHPEGYGLGAALISWGSVERISEYGDNSLVATIDMNDYLVVSVCGNCNDTAPYPDEKEIFDNCPVAVYKGGSPGSMLMPSDDSTTNYIVFSGKIRLAPVTEVSQNWSGRSSGSLNEVDGKDMKRYYMRTFWETKYPCGPVSNSSLQDYGLCPPDEDGPELFEFNHARNGVTRDDLSKLSVLACMLIIGNKCLVETGTQGQISDFEWREYKTREQCADDDEYYAQSFTIGFDPKIGDMLIGPEYDIQNNISFDLGLNAEGMAIPVRKSDALSGSVEFRILGPVNLSWDNYTYKHNSFWRAGGWSSTSKPLMAHVQNIYIKDFEIKVHSDNSMYETEGVNDLIYMSDVEEKFINKKDDLQFKITSALTAEERVALGVKATLNLSSPVVMATDEVLLSLYDNNMAESGKPEQFYVDEAYREWHKPKVTIRQNMDDRKTPVNRRDIFMHPVFNDKKFFIQGISRNLIAGETMLNLKEIGND